VRSELIRNVTVSNFELIMSEVHTALHFLSNIPFGGHNEKVKRNKRRRDRKSTEEEEESSSSSSSDSEEDEETTSRLVEGNKNFVPVVPIRGEKWEAAMLRRGFLKGRIFFSPSTTSGASSTSRSYPTTVVSVVGYDGKKRIAQKMSNQQWKKVPTENTKYSKRGFSTRHLLHATWGQCCWIRDQRDDHPARDMVYHPDFLDDPEIRQSKQRTVMHLSGVHMQTMIPYVRVHELEDQLNSQFRQKHPWLSPDITLSMIRRLKRITVQISLRCGGHEGLELGTVALAHVCFEKLILRRHVNKDNFKTVMACCLVLAFKFNEPSGGATLLGNSQFATPMTRRGETVREDLYGKIEQYLSIDRISVIKLEFTVFTWLRFELHLRPFEIDPHFTRILKSLKPEQTQKGYLGRDMYEKHLRILETERHGTKIISPMRGL